MSASMDKQQSFRHVLVVEDRKARRIITLESDTYTIGRDSNSSIVIYDQQVSRHHATIRKNADTKNGQLAYVIVDGNLEGKRSTNGITVNGRPSLERELQHGDLICFGGNVKASYHLLSDRAEIERLRLANAGSAITHLDAIDGAERTQTSTREIEQLTQEELLGLASFPELSPSPIVEIDWEGNVTYLNPAAALKFTLIYQEKLNHPVLSGLLNERHNQQGNLFVREIRIGEEIYEQYVHYLVENQRIRSYLFDFTRRKAAETRYRIVIEQISQGLLLADAQSKGILEANSAYCQLLGYKSEDLENLTLYDIIALEQEQLDSQLGRLQASQEGFVSELIHRSKNGSFVAVEAGISLIAYGEQQLLCFVVRQLNVSQFPEPEGEDVDILPTQPLLSLPDQKRFDEQLATAIALAQIQGRLVTMLLVDLDRFEMVKDTFGTEVGDRLLQDLAQRLHLCLRRGDTIARYQGDRLGIVLPGLTTVKDIATVCQRLLAALKRPLSVEGGQLQINSRIGVAVYPQDGQTPQALLTKAEAVLARQTATPSPDLYTTAGASAKSPEQLRLESLLKQAFEQESFDLYYQPQINVRTGKLSGMEVYLRWQRPELADLEPAQLMAAAEETGLMYQMTRWQLQGACRQNRIWQEAGLPTVRIAVELTPQQFQMSSLVAIVSQALVQTGLDPQWLELEIPAIAAMREVKAARQTLWQLREKGVYLVMSDFGAAPSSFHDLKKLPFDGLKINASFIQNLATSPQDVAIVTAVIALSRGFNLRAIAEGVNAPEQVAMLRRLQCEYMQGDLFSPPVLKDKIEEFLASPQAINV
ncbi:MAG: EAL domain-containing protein [Chloroflexaceae bacterium]|nr:EAL domain-containing protein [Chloroflexaceae bacterium]